MPLVSAILITSEPLQHPELTISTRILIEPMDLRDSSKLVHSVNPQLSRTQRKDVVMIGKGNPDTLTTLAKMPKSQLKELKIAQGSRMSVMDGTGR